MPLEKIPFGPFQSTGYDELGGASPVAHNVVFEPTGTVRRRPGIQFLDGVAQSVVDADGIDALHFAQNGKLYAAGGSLPLRNIYQVSGGVLNLTPGNEFRLHGDRRPIVAETEAMLVFAAGRRPQKLVFAEDNPSKLGGAAECSHLIANNSRLLSNDVTDGNRGLVRFSSQAAGSSFAGHELWTVGEETAGFFSGEARPDPVVALGENTSEVFIFGAQTVQVFAPDPVLTYSPVVTREWGCSTPYGIVRREQAFGWLDDERRVLVSDARSEEDIGAPIRQTLQEMDSVTDAIGYRVLSGPTDALVWTFPDGRTFAYQVGGGWAQWTTREGGNWARFPVNAHTVRSSDGKNLVGLTDGRIGWLDPAAADDLGEPIQADVVTGYHSRGTEMRKFCSAVYLTLRRGHLSSDDVIGWLQWRDRPGPWVSSVPVRFGARGETEAVVTLRSLGVYRRRQWRFVFSGSGAFALVAAQEEFEVLGE